VEGDKVTRKCHGQMDKDDNYYIYNQWCIYCPYTHGTFIQKSGDTKCHDEKKVCIYAHTS
jgi:hypothetical protein